MNQYFLKIAEASVNVLYDASSENQSNIDEQFGMQTVEDISNNIKSGALQTYLNELPEIKTNEVK